MVVPPTSADRTTGGSFISSRLWNVVSVMPSAAAAPAGGVAAEAASSTSRWRP
jgi:hypothetical protein